ncbi:hypothetical protein K503DRAFT_782863 [Rhizopogon vinicolor AM-OR11-026]|uniref:Uncharacterized protein n=1 Tax=Rhizopogon vinicolor AM-OR11-026 TaxID=1314800 RepID=A0A1B7N0T3_9AGAM|nr:hypothetical protein K503DRAFT_782863 [Rhizopogon vinicolor AM-OR11-026]
MSTDLVTSPRYGTTTKAKVNKYSLLSPAPHGNDLLEFRGCANNEQRNVIGREPFANAQRFSTRSYRYRIAISYETKDTSSGKKPVKMTPDSSPMVVEPGTHWVPVAKMKETTHTSDNARDTGLDDWRSCHCRTRKQYLTGWYISTMRSCKCPYIFVNSNRTGRTVVSVCSRTQANIRT